MPFNDLDLGLTLSPARNTGGVVPPVTLQALTLSSSTANPAFSATIGNKTSGSTISATSSDGTVLTVVGNAISGTFTANGTPSITLTETLAGATNTPRQTVLPVTVSGVAAPFAQTAAILGAGGLDYAFFDYSLANSLFQDEAGTIPASQGNTIGRWSVRDKAPHYASQSVSAQRPLLQADGLKPDGSDDVLFTDWFAQAGANAIMAQVKIPSSFTETQQVIGAAANGNGERYFLAVTAAGRLCAGIGNTNTNVLFGGSDRRGSEVVFAVVINGTTVNIYSDEGTVYSGAQSGTPVLSTPLTVAARNVGTNGPTNFSTLGTKRIALARTAFTLEQFQTMRAEWLAAA